MTKETTLVIEEAFYNQMVIKDVNNYLAEYTDSTSDNEHIKYKGCFEIDKEYHKDNSMRIVPIAIKKHFIDGLSVEEIVKNHKNMYDFCMRLKINSSSNAYYNVATTDGIIKTPLNRTTRYYVSNGGGGLSVYYNGSSEVTRINKGYNATLFNKFEEKENYDINYQFYISEVYKIINVIEDFQLSLF